MDEACFQLIKTLGFALSFVLIFLVQTLGPYRRVARPVPGNWRRNVPIAVLNTILTSLVGDRNPRTPAPDGSTRSRQGALTDPAGAP